MNCGNILRSISHARPLPFIAAMLVLALVVACDPSADGQPAPAPAPPAAAPAAAANASASAAKIEQLEAGLPAVRVHNARFDLPPGLEIIGRGTMRPGTPVIIPVPYPDGNYVRVDAGYAQPGEQGAAALAKQYLLDARKKFGDSVKELSPAVIGKHPRGYEIAIQHLTIPERGFGLCEVFVAHFTAGARGQTMWLIASKPELFAKNRPLFEKVIDSVVILSSLEVAPEVAELGSADLYDVYRMQDFVEWMLDAKLTPAQRAQIGGHLADTWRQKDAAVCRSIAETLAAYEQALTKEPLEQELARAAARTDFLKQWHAKAKEGDAKSKLMLEIYATAQPTLADTKDGPPLTRHTSDATLQVLYFIAAKVANPYGGPGANAKPDAKALETWAGEIAKAYPGLSKEEKEQLAEMPLVAATLNLAWPKTSAEERAKLIAEWKQLPFVQQLAGQNRADHEHMRQMQAAIRGFDAQQRLTNMGAYRLSYWRW